MANFKFFLQGICLIFATIAFGTMPVSWCRILGLSSILATVLYIFTGILLLLGLFLGGALMFLSSQRVSKHHSTISALHLFIVKYQRLFVGSRRLKELRYACKNPREAQETLLKEIMMKNKDTDYGRQFHLDQIHSLEDFRKNHPVTEYDHFKSFVDKLCKGERNVMTKNKVSRIVLTSGTTGTNKLIPQDENYFDDGLSMQEAFQHEMFPDLHPMQPKLKIHINSQVKQSEGGISIAAATVVEEHMTKHYAVYTPPPEGQLIGTALEAFYIDLLFSLREKQMGSIWLTFSSILVDFMRHLQENWLDLVDDLSNGTIRSDLKLTPGVRAALTRRLGAGDPVRAMEVKQECERGFEGIIKRLWPNCKFIACIDNVNIRKHLKETFGKGVEIYTSLYASSEAFLGLNLWPFEDGKGEYALNLREVIYEFIKIEDSEMTNPTTYFVDEVEIGQAYELIISQKYGIYRFRFGDVVKITGFYQNCPKITFLYRKATILNLVGERVDQDVVRQSLDATLDPWKHQVKLEYYSCCESSLFSEMLESSKERGLHYLFFLELASKIGDDLPNDLTPETLAKDIQSNLCQRHSYYENCVKAKRITMPKVYLTEKGSFVALKEYIIENSATSRAQFKMPVKLRKVEMSKVLLNPTPARA